MELSTLFRKWWVLLIQGILMIALSILIFKNPGAVLATLAGWLGALVIITGLVGVIAWFAASKEDRNIFAILGSIAICILGILMIFKLVNTMKAITIVFGVFVTLAGLMVIVGSWNGRKNWSRWWLIALIGLATLILGVISVMDIYSGAQNISTLIGISVLLSGIGQICVAFLKKVVGSTIKTKQVS